MKYSMRLYRRGIGKVEVLIILSIIAILAAIFYPNFMNSAARGPMMACHANLRNISHAIERYAEENEGKLPKSLSELSPKHLEALPLCQGSETYSTTYQLRTASKDSVVTWNDQAYSLYCKGDNHSWYLEPNMPCWDSEKGLLQGPDERNNPFVGQSD